MRKYRVTVVTAYVPIDGHPRSEQEYDRLGRHLLDIDANVLFAKGELERCWLLAYLTQHYSSAEITCSTGDNPQKNSLPYHIVQAQKTELLEVATYADCYADVFVWIDYGIFHVPGVTAEIIEDFVRRTANEQAIAIPGCWRKDEFDYRDEWPCWRWCGGVMVVPRRYVEPFNHAMKREYARWIEATGNVSWEINTLARLERYTDLPLWWYGPCDHDQTMFTNYRATEHANGAKS